MVPSFIIAMIIAIFCHQMELCYNPAGYVGLESTLFILISLVALNKGPSNRETSSKLWKIVSEVICLCLKMQVLMVTVWFIGYVLVHALVEASFNTARTVMSDEHAETLDKVQPYAWTICVLTLEAAFVFKTIKMDGLQKYFGVVDDLRSETHERLARQRIRGYSRRRGGVSVRRR